MITSFAAAKKICDLSEWKVDNLKLQKLLYFANMVFLGRKKEPLIPEKFQAWDYGPVLPSVYHHLKIFGIEAVQNRFYNVEVVEDDKEESKVLKDVWDHIGHKEGWELVKITHRPDGAWSKNYIPRANKVICDMDILEEYTTHVR